jgi:tricarballylate dehydrogenase
MSKAETCDVIVIGGGSSAFEAAVSARQTGAGRVVMLEKAPEAEYGGNARFSHTGFRFCHSGKKEVREFIPDVDADEFGKW